MFEYSPAPNSFAEFANKSSFCAASATAVTDLPGKSVNCRLQLISSMEHAIDCSRRSLVSMGFHVLQIGHYRLLAYGDRSKTESVTIELNFQKSGIDRIEVILIKLARQARATEIDTTYGAA